jgi:hypothetical protein
VFLTFTFGAGSLFVCIVAIGNHLRLVAPRRATPPAWSFTVVAAFTAGAVAFAFHDSLLTHQTVTGPSALYFGAGLAAATVSIAIQKARHLHKPPDPRQ